MNESGVNVLDKPRVQAGGREPLVPTSSLYRRPFFVEAGSETSGTVPAEAAQIPSSLENLPLHGIAPANSHENLNSGLNDEPQVNRAVLLGRVAGIKSSIADSFKSTKESLKGRFKSARRIGAIALSLSLIGSSAPAQDSSEAVKPSEPAPAAVSNDKTFEFEYSISQSANLVQESIDEALAAHIPVEIQPEPEVVSEPATPQGVDIDISVINEAIDRYEHMQTIETDSADIERAISEYEQRELEKQEAARLAREQLLADYKEVGEIVEELYAATKPGDMIGYVTINGEQLTDRNGELVYLYHSVGFFQDDPVEGKFIDYVEKGPGMPDDYKIGTSQKAAVLGHFSSGEQPAPMRNLKDVKEDDVLVVTFQKELEDGSYQDLALLSYFAESDAFSIEPNEVEHFTNQETEIPKLTVGTCGNIAGNTGSTTLFRTIVPFELQQVYLSDTDPESIVDATGTE